MTPLEQVILSVRPEWAIEQVQFQSTWMYVLSRYPFQVRVNGNHENHHIGIDRPLTPPTSRDKTPTSLHDG